MKYNCLDICNKILKFQKHGSKINLDCYYIVINRYYKIMSIKIPTAYTKQVMSRNFVKQIASDGFLPVIALEAFVESGRTYQAYQRGGFDEARERITEEFSGAVFWLSGVTALNALFEKLGQKLLKLPKINVSVAKDDVRNPLPNFLKFEKTTDGAKILEKTMAKFKFAKVISSVLITNAFIGFALPKINQAITRYYHRNKPVENVEKPEVNTTQKTSMDSFMNKNNEDKKDISFGFNMLAVANKFETNRNYKLLSVDAGTATGRTISARNNDERVEILFRDLASVYFYMFNMNNMNSWLNKIEQKGNPDRLDPVSAEFTTKYMESYVDEAGQIIGEGKQKSVPISKFKQDMLGEKAEIPKAISEKLQGEKIKIITLDEFKQLLQADEKFGAKFEQLSKVADKMSELQPQIKGVSILTEGQIKDILTGGHINNPEFLKEFYKNRFGKDFMDKYQYVAQKDLDRYKKELTDYVKSIIENASLKGEEITVKMLNKASKSNLKWNAINWGAGFVTSALFLSTLIPKMQYQITKWRTGSNEFPGTKQFREEEQK